MKTKWN